MAKKNQKKKPTPATPPRAEKNKPRNMGMSAVKMMLADSESPEKDPKDCKHERFLCQSNVLRITDQVPATKDSPIKAFALDIKIHCEECGTPFEFIGVTAGLSPFVPMASADFLELRAPIRPSDTPVAKTEKNKLN